MQSMRINKKGNAKAALSRLFFPHGKKGIEMTMQLIVVVIILLALMVFVLIFLTGQGNKVTNLWDSISSTAINQSVQ